MNTTSLNFETKTFRHWLDYVAVQPTTSISCEEILKLIEFSPDEAHGNDDASVVSQTGYCYAKQANSAVFAGNKTWLEMAMESESVSCVFTNARAVKALNRPIEKTTWVSESAAEWFHVLHNHSIQNQCYEKMPTEGHISKTANIASSAILRGAVFVDDDVTIGPNTIVTGPVYIGPSSRVEELVTIGSRGLFAKKVKGVLREFNYYGGVTIGANSHIHARANIAASPHFLTFTQIGNNVSLGISANVGHDCVIHDNSTVASTACVCGRGVVMENAWVGAGAIVSDARVVHANARVRIGSVVIADVPAGADVSGNFAIRHSRSLREYTKRK